MSVPFSARVLENGTDAYSVVKSSLIPGIAITGKEVACAISEITGGLGVDARRTLHCNFASRMVCAVILFRADGKNICEQLALSC